MQPFLDDPVFNSLVFLLYHNILRKFDHFLYEEVLGDDVKQKTDRCNCYKQPLHHSQLLQFR